MHAREWIAPAVATFIARELVEHYASHPEYVNFAYHYAESGISSNTCSNSYCGPHAFYEVESECIRDFVRWLSPIPVLVTRLHSYGQDWLWLYGYARNAYPDYWRELKAVYRDKLFLVSSLHHLNNNFEPLKSIKIKNNHIFTCFQSFQKINYF